MSKELTIINNEAVKYLQAMGLTDKLTAKETDQFLEICKAYQLNPFKREIYGIKYGNNFNIIVGYETYLKRAERSGKLAGWQVITSGNVKDNSLKATITIYRHDFKEPFVHEVYFAEYRQDTAIWKSKPVTMTKKVAMAQGFRLAFPDDLGGMPYTQDEMPTEDAVFTVIDAINDDGPELNAAIREITECDDLECVKTTWTKHKKWQKNPDFMAAKDLKKEQLSNPVEEATEEQSN
jgi:phage recombination protein Bet